MPSRLMIRLAYDFLWKKQQEYDTYRVQNIWGFGDKMRDYLLEGKRRIPLGRV
jgi:hypothetical protein